MPRTVIEPFKIKVAEPLSFLTRAERERVLENAGYNLFQVPAAAVTIDLLTDSGTSAMSARQWAGIMEGDESYAGSRSFFRFEKTVRELTGFQYIIPTHQGRAAEHILFQVVAGQNKIIPNNTHFDTTRANVESTGALALDLVCDEAKDGVSAFPFKGNLNLARLTTLLQEERGRIPLVMVTVTNNSLGGQPVSLENLRAVSNLCRSYHVPLFLDACRFAENAFFIKLRENGCANRSARDIAQEMFSLCDGCTMSAKKDALVNIGGFLALNSADWAERARHLLILTEGFPTYGGLAGRDLEAMAQGLDEILDESYLAYRLRSLEYFGQHLMNEDIPIVQPVGGHAVYINATEFLPHIPKSRLPAQALACELYLQAGVRGVEIGTLMFGETARDRPELLRLAVPRRVYTQSHIDYVVEALGEVKRRKNDIRGLCIQYEAPVLRHFTARLARV